MIEIRTDVDAEPARPDGPHDPMQTRAIADGIDEAFRLLNYATMKRDGLRWPSDVYSVLGLLAGGVAKLPQALEQMEDFVVGEVAGGFAHEDAFDGEHGGDTAAAQAALQAAVVDATAHAKALVRALQAGQSAMRGMASTRDEDGE